MAAPPCQFDAIGYQVGSQGRVDHNTVLVRPSPRSPRPGFNRKLLLLLLQQHPSARGRIAVASYQGAQLVATGDDQQQKDGYLVRAFGWTVRDVNPKKQKDLHDIARIQAGAFHERAPVFDDFFHDLFKAEVLSALSYKIRLSPPRRYTCLVAEMDGDERDMVGVVDLTALANKDVLQHLQEADEYLYLSGLAVDAKYRRRSAATALLQGADLRALCWGFPYLVLHAYEDDERAQNLYARAGYQTIGLDPPWFTSWIGRKRRVVMAKRLPNPSAASSSPALPLLSL